MNTLTVDTNLEVLCDTYDDCEEAILLGMIEEIQEDSAYFLMQGIYANSVGNYSDSRYYKEQHFECIAQIAEMEKRIANKPAKELIVGDNGIYEVQDTLPIDPTAPTFGNMLDFIDPTEYQLEE